MKGLLFTYGLCYGGAAVALFNPYVGLLIYICFAIIKPESLWYWSVPQGNYSRVVAVALLLGWLLRGFGNWRFGRARALVVALLGYWLTATLAATWAIDKDLAWGFVENLTKIVLPFLVGITVIDSVAKLRALGWVVVLSQGYLALEFNLSYFSGYNSLRWDGFAGMDNNSVAIALVTCIGMAFFLGLDASKLYLKGLAFAAAALMAHAVLFSFSRGGMLALTITGLIGFFLLPKNWKAYLWFIAAALIALRLAGPQVAARFSTAFASEETRDRSAETRLELWAVCWDLMKDNPIGIGPNQFGVVVSRYGFPEGRMAHTLWLTTGAELGFLGLGLLASFYGLCILRLWPLTRSPASLPDPWLGVAARMVIASLVGFGVSAQFVSLTTLEVPYYVALVGAVALKLATAPIEIPQQSRCEPTCGADSES